MEVSLSHRVRNVSPSPTLQITSLAKRLKKEGKDIINFAAGEPDFDTPPQIKEEAIKAIEDGFTKYTPSSGILELKEKIREKFKRDNNLEYDIERIIVSNGAKHSLYNTCQVLLEEGDQVIIPSPFWVSYPEMVRLSGAKPVILKTHPEDNFKISPKKIEEIITDKTKVLILNSPNNPVGYVYTREELEEIASICISKNIYVLSDEVYEKIIFDKNYHLSIGSLNKDIYDLTITVNGVSKSFSMTGWRIGYLGGPKEITEAIENLQDHSTSNPSSISQRAALAALNMPEDFYKEMVKEFQRRRDYITEVLDSLELFYIKPQGAFYIFCDISKTNLDSLNFSKRLLEERGIVVIPGESFGRSDFIRISFATKIDEIKRGMERFKEWIEKLI